MIVTVHSQQIDIVTFAIWNIFKFWSFDLWRLNGRLDKEATVDTFACPSMCNTMTLLFLPFEIVYFWGVRKWLLNRLWPLLKEVPIWSCNILLTKVCNFNFVGGEAFSLIFNFHIVKPKVQMGVKFISHKFEHLVTKKRNSCDTVPRRLCPFR